jgi:hypothetical protein
MGVAEDAKLDLLGGINAACLGRSALSICRPVSRVRNSNSRTHVPTRKRWNRWSCRLRRNDPGAKCLRHPHD